MRRRPELSTLDRFAIRVVSLFGFCIGLLIASASDVRITPTLVMIFPGILIEVAVVRLWGATAAVIACGIANGLACPVSETRKAAATTMGYRLRTHGSV
jgi:hypothetical protein